MNSKLDSIRDIIAGRTVLVTGAGGSVGSELCRQIATLCPRRLLLVDKSEGNLFKIEQELIDAGHGSRVVALMADVVDMPRMHDILETYQPRMVFHAAAYKRISLMERHPGQAIENNTLGAVCVATLASEFLATRFVLISTDDATHPTNVIGATRRLAEMFVQSLSLSAGNRTRFMSVRLGNIPDVSAESIPSPWNPNVFDGMTESNHLEIALKPLTLHAVVTLVLESTALGKGGEIFVLNRRHPFEPAVIARPLGGQSGNKDREFLPTDHPQILRLRSCPPSIEEFQQRLQSLFGRLQDTEADELKLMLRQLIPEYRPARSPVPVPTPGRAAGASSETPAGNPPLRSRNQKPT